MGDKLIHIYYGYGKGKTTAAVGMAYRASVRGMKVLFTAFLKSKNSGEFIYDGPFDVDEFDFYDKFWNKLTEFQKCESVEKIKAKMSDLEKKAEAYDMIILDEFLDVISLGCVSTVCAMDFLKSLHSKCEIIITGHKAQNDIFDIADYITHMQKEKHPYDKGVKARIGIEY